MSADADLTDWLDDASLRARSQGVVETPESYSYRTCLPERRGLYSQAIFGPLSWKERDLRAPSMDDRRDRWGHIELAEPCPRAAGPDRGVVLVAPPVFRQFRLVVGAECHQMRRTTRQHLIDTCRDPNELRERLLEAGLEKLEDITATDETLVEPRLNTAYRYVLNGSVRLRRLLELDAPVQVIEEARVFLRDSCLWVDAETANAMPAPIAQLALGHRG